MEKKIKNRNKNYNNSNKTMVKKLSVSNLKVLLFTHVQKLYGPEISQYLPCLLQILNQLRQLFIFLTT